MGRVSSKAKLAKKEVKAMRYRAPDGREYTEEELQERRKLFFEPVHTKEELRLFLKVFFDIQWPDHILDEDSTSTPLQFVWDVYNTFLTNKGPKRFVVAASRSSSKTLCASVIHMLSMIHFRRKCLHIAAIKPQAGVCMEYMDKFCVLPEVADYFTADNATERRLDSLPENSYTRQSGTSVSIVAASMKGANSKRASCLGGATRIATGALSSRVIEEIWREVTEAETCPRVVSFNSLTGAYEIDQVVAAQRRPEPNRLHIWCGNQYVDCTPEHPMAVSHTYGTVEYVPAGELRVGDSLLLAAWSGLQPVPIVRIDKIVVTDPRSMYVYDLQTKNNHNFIADTFLVHNCLIKDEIDLTPRTIIAEVAGVMDATWDEHQFAPVSIGLSSRKTNDGPLQDDINQAEEEIASGKDPTIKLVKFSVVDWMKKCTTAGKEIGNLYVSTSTLRMYWGEEEFQTVPELERSQHKCYPIYENCRACPALIPCFGRATKQINTSPRLRDKESIATIIAAVKDPNVIIAQYCNWRPETTGIVYRLFDVMRHCKTYLQAWHWLSGKPWNHAVLPTLPFLVQWMRANGWGIYWGIDWGYTDPASCVIMAYHQTLERAVILKVLTKTGFANNQWADFLADHVPEYLRPDLVCPDTEDAASASYFRKHGLRCRKEKPRKITTGVSQIRGLLWNPKIQSEQMIVLADQTDPDILDMQVMVHQFTHWKHKRTPTGEWDTNAFEDGGDHCLDPARYILDLFIKNKAKPHVATESNATVDPNVVTPQVPSEIMRTYADNGAPHAFAPINRQDLLKNSPYAQLIADTLPGAENEASAKRSGKVKFFY